MVAARQTTNVTALDLRVSLTQLGQRGAQIINRFAPATRDLVACFSLYFEQALPRGSIPIPGHPGVASPTIRLTDKRRILRRDGIEVACQ